MHSNMLNTGFELNGTRFSQETLPSVADNLIKSGKLTLPKFGLLTGRIGTNNPATLQ